MPIKGEDMLFFQKKHDRAMEIMNEKNRDYLKSQGFDPDAKDEENKFDPSTMEKGDLPAIIISAFLVFGPIILILGIILVLAFRMLH